MSKSPTALIINKENDFRVKIRNVNWGNVRYLFLMCVGGGHSPMLGIQSIFNIVLNIDLYI